MRAGPGGAAARAARGVEGYCTLQRTRTDPLRARCIDPRAVVRCMPVCAQVELANQMSDRPVMPRADMALLLPRVVIGGYGGNLGGINGA